jgi:two-component system NtrC family sensor kinase
VQSEKLAALGQLVAGIAHEINNPVGFIYANLHQIAKYVDQLKSGSLDPTQEKTLLKLAAAAGESRIGAERVRDLVQNLRGLARAENPGGLSPETREPCDLQRLMEASLTLARTAMDPGIEVKRDYGELPSIAGHAASLQQVFLNLFVNAAQAMGSQGTLTLSLRQENDRLLAKVSDTGPGLPPEILQRIFEPFFTTKPQGQGLGLGLHISYDIVKAHGGELMAENIPEGGACFTLSLPLAS